MPALPTDQHAAPAQLHLAVVVQRPAAHAIQLIPIEVDLQTTPVKQEIALASKIIKGYLKTSFSSFQVAFSHFGAVI